jgi:peptide methionine sulfoxide reductase MsrB
MTNPTDIGPSDEAIRMRLTPLQYRVTQEAGTERALTGEYGDTKGVFPGGPTATGERYGVNSTSLCLDRAES